MNKEQVDNLVAGRRGKILDDGERLAKFNKLFNYAAQKCGVEAGFMVVRADGTKVRMIFGGSQRPKLLMRASALDSVKWRRLTLAKLREDLWYWTRLWLDRLSDRITR